MSVYVSAELTDINEKKAVTGAWVADAAAADDYLAALKAASNAKISKAWLSTPVPLTTITNNDATAANVETVRTKALVKMRGADTGSAAEPFARVTIGIPAPIGTLINGATGDVTDAEIQSLKTKVLSRTGVQMSTVERIQYSR